MSMGQLLEKGFTMHIEHNQIEVFDFQHMRILRARVTSHSSANGNLTSLKCQRTNVH